MHFARYFTLIILVLTVLLLFTFIYCGGEAQPAGEGYTEDVPNNQNTARIGSSAVTDEGIEMETEEEAWNMADDDAGALVPAPPAEPDQMLSGMLNQPTVATTSRSSQGATDAIMDYQAYEEPEPVEVVPTPAAPDNNGLGETDFFYFSYDDSASTVGVELTKHALENDRMPSVSWARPWEFLNFEDFNATGGQNVGLFTVSTGLWEHPQTDDEDDQDVMLYELGVEVHVPTITKDQRQNVVITLLVDVSGSMDSALQFNSGRSNINSKLDAAKYGMITMVNSLKQGDVINLITFSDTSYILLEGIEYSNTGISSFRETVNGLASISGTNLNRGVQTGYEVARRTYDSSKMNRVVILTDANANEGVIDPTIIANATRINNQEGIYFSGIGFGEDFNEAFLNELTEEGRGAYFSVISPKDADTVFYDRFIALMNVAARNVRFRLDYPAAFGHGETAAEQVSTIAAQVQPTNFSYNTSQFFLESFSLEGINFDQIGDEEFTLTISYTHPETLEAIEEQIVFSAQSVIGRNTSSIKDAYIVTLLPSLIKGKVSIEEAENRLALLENHNSVLENEYRELIDTWINLRNEYSARR